MEAIIPAADWKDGRNSFIWCRFDAVVNRDLRLRAHVSWIKLCEETSAQIVQARLGYYHRQPSEVRSCSMRKACRVRVNIDEYNSLTRLLGLAYNQKALKQFPAAVALLERMREDLADEPADVIERADQLYREDDLEIDDDAPLSRCDYGCWVGAWVWVPARETDIDVA
jgi:hypothetical protein